IKPLGLINRMWEENYNNIGQCKFIRRIEKRLVTTVTFGYREIMGESIEKWNTNIRRCDVNDPSKDPLSQLPRELLFHPV
ncbi:MAG: hypothetical protein MUO76_13220, partial [Anaerolineaceae bacterium]|nr:hypothetical protein [Anaerolineaceae bacterium]